MSQRVLLFGGDPKEQSEKYLQRTSVTKNVIMNKQYTKLVGHSLYQITGMNIKNIGNIFEKKQPAVKNLFII